MAKIQGVPQEPQTHRSPPDPGGRAPNRLGVGGVGWGPGQSGCEKQGSASCSTSVKQQVKAVLDRTRDSMVTGVRESLDMVAESGPDGLKKWKAQEEESTKSCKCLRPYFHRHPMRPTVRSLAENRQRRYKRFL